jgi:hypothetical protein
MTGPVNVICMKWGSMYGPEYVNRLHRAVARHLQRPHRFVCMADDGTGLDAEVEVRPLPSLGLPAGHQDRRWQKLAVYGRELFDLKGVALFLDLDLVIVGSLEPFFEHPGRFLILRDDDLFRSKPLRKLRPARDRFLGSVGNSSVFRFEIGAHPEILDAYLADPEAATARFEISQQFLTFQLQRLGLLQYWPEGWCVSFKNACVPRLWRSYFANPVIPPGALIVVFAGSPKMSEVMGGGGSRWYRRIGPAPWLHEAWR